MVDRPLEHEGECAPWKGSPCDSQFSNVDDSFVFTHRSHGNGVDHALANTSE